jgi:hypothetical protein
MSDIRFKLQTENAKKKFIKLMQNCDDLSPVFKDFVTEYKEIVAQNFEAHGKIMERQRWVNYTPEYLYWKQKHYPGKPMLELSGDLKAAATNFKSDVSSKSLVMTIDGADYFFYVQERKTNPRHYFNTPDDDLPIQAWKVLIEKAENYIMKDMD